MTRVAVLGTGIMGTGIAHSLVRGGFEVVVWNRNSDKAEAVGAGTTVAQSPGDAVKGCDLVFTMLSNVSAVEDVASQFLEHFKDGVWCQCSTVGLEGTARLAELAAKHDVTLVECPVSGTKQPAEDGKLTVIAAGPEGARDRVQAAFDAIGTRTEWVGTNPVKASATKLMMNSWVVGLTALLAETLAFARVQDIDPALFLSMIEGGPLDTPYAQLKGRMMIDGSYDSSFPLALAAKDARLVGQAAAEKGLALPVNSGVAALYAKVEQSHGAQDMAAVIEALVAVNDIA